MRTDELIILSYHKFTEQSNPYTFSRTYLQFAHDIDKKVYDLITIDDGMSCMIRACSMLRASNRRAKLFICTSLVGQEGYCTWDELRILSRNHDIENHAHLHVFHTDLNFDEIKASVTAAQDLITFEIGKAPRYFVAPYNTYKGEVDEVAESLNLITLKNRETIKNSSK